MYFSSLSPDGASISVAKLNGVYRTKILHNGDAKKNLRLENPSSIAVHPVNGFVPVVYSFKLCSHRAKAKTFFDVCRLFCDLFRLFFDLFSLLLSPGVNRPFGVRNYKLAILKPHLHVPSTSPFFLPYKNGLNAVLWCVKKVKGAPLPQERCL